MITDNLAIKLVHYRYDMQHTMVALKNCVSKDVKEQNVLQQSKHLNVLNCSKWTLLELTYHDYLKFSLSVTMF